MSAKRKVEIDLRHEIGIRKRPATLFELDESRFEDVVEGLEVE